MSTRLTLVQARFYSLLLKISRRTFPDKLVDTRRVDLWARRSDYGTVFHDLVAQYNLRLGFFDVPSNLHRLPPVENGIRHVEFMGGAAAVLHKAQADYDKGAYRWVAEVVNPVVFADAQNTAAKHLLTDAYEQMGDHSDGSRSMRTRTTGWQS